MIWSDDVSIRKGLGKLQPYINVFEAQNVVFRFLYRTSDWLSSGIDIDTINVSSLSQNRSYH